MAQFSTIFFKKYQDVCASKIVSKLRPKAQIISLMIHLKFISFVSYQSLTKINTITFSIFNGGFFCVNFLANFVLKFATYLCFCSMRSFLFLSSFFPSNLHAKFFNKHHSRLKESNVLHRSILHYFFLNELAYRSQNNSLFLCSSSTTRAYSASFKSCSVA